MIQFGYVRPYMPWEVWQVRPIRPIEYHVVPASGLVCRQLRTRSMAVIRAMPAGFEFGPNGAAVRGLVEQLARLRHKTTAAQHHDSDYDDGLAHLKCQHRPLDRLHVSRMALAMMYLDCLASESLTGPAGRWQHHLPADTPAYAVLSAAIAGLSIPDAVALRWNLVADHTN